MESLIKNLSVKLQVPCQQQNNHIKQLVIKKFAFSQTQNHINRTNTVRIYYCGYILVRIIGNSAYTLIDLK